jgi:hypothetical protein
VTTQMINNQDSIQTKKGIDGSDPELSKKKAFNIQLSADDDKENVYHLNDSDSDPDSDDDYEYVEEDEITKEQQKRDKPEAISEADKPTNSQKTEPNEEENNKTKQTETSASAQIEENDEEIDQNTICHRIYNKGAYIDLSEIITTKFVKIKPKKNLLSIIGISNKKSIEKNYLALFNENYIYFMKDIEVNKSNKLIRKIGNKYNIKLLYNASFKVYNSVLYINIGN